MNKRKYQPNLHKLQQTCAVNYALALRLLPLEYNQGESWFVTVNGQNYYQIQILESTKYTDKILLSQTQQVNPLIDPKIEFRLFHDAQMAEVLTYQQTGRIRQKYDYPNPNLFQQDEKIQINQLLKEWLHLSLSKSSLVTKQKVASE